MNGLNGHRSPDPGPSSSFTATIAELIGQLQKDGTLSPSKQSDPYKIGQIVMNYVKEAKQTTGSSSKERPGSSQASSGSGIRNGGYSSSHGAQNSSSQRAESSHRSLPFFAPPKNFQQAFSSRTQQIIKESLQSRKNLTRRSSDSSISMVDDRLGSPDKLRRQLDLKARRKKRRSFIKKMMDGVEQFGLDENTKLSDLPGKLRECFQDMYERGIIQVKIYLSAVESLRDFFRHKTFPNSVESSVREFLRTNMFKDWRPQVKDSKTEGFQLECETYTLLKLHSLENLEENGKMTEECRRELADLSKFLQGLKIAVPHLEVEHFLESTVVELFIDTMPECVQELMDQCQVSTLPLEFETERRKEESEEETEPEISISPLKIRRSSKSKRSILGSNRSALHSSKRKLSSSRDPHDRDRHSKRPRRDKDSKRQRRVVAETPCSKQVAPSLLRRQSMLDTVASVIEDSPVRQSPRQHPSTLALRNNASKISKAHSLLLQRKKLVEKAKAPLPAAKDVSKRRSSSNIVAPLLRARRSLSQLSSPPGKSTRSSDSLRSPEPDSEVAATEFRSPRTRKSSRVENWSEEKRRLPSQRAPMKNLNATLASCSAAANTDAHRGSKRSLERPEPPSTPKISKTQTPKSPVPDPADGALDELISDAVAAKYRTYVQKLRASKSKGKLNEDNLFYARGSVRANVFQAVEEEKKSVTSPTIITRQTSATSPSASSPAKNRAGRKIKEAKFSHVANYLLNDKNENPSSPVIPKFLVRKNPSDIRISRLLRYPSRSRRKTMKRLRSDECSVTESHESGHSGESLETIKQETLCPSSPAEILAVDTSTSSQTRDLQTLRVELKKLEIDSLMLSPRMNGLNGLTAIVKSNGIVKHTHQHQNGMDSAGGRSSSACGSRRHSINGLMLSPTRRRSRRSEDEMGSAAKISISERVLLSPRKNEVPEVKTDAKMAYTQINGKVSEEKEIPDQDMTSEYGSDIERTSSPIL